MRGRAGPVPTATELSTSGSQARPNCRPAQSEQPAHSFAPPSSSPTRFLAILAFKITDYEMKGGVVYKSKCYPIRVDQIGTSCHTLLVTRYLSRHACYTVMGTRVTLDPCQDFYFLTFYTDSFSVLLAVGN